MPAGGGPQKVNFEQPSSGWALGPPDLILDFDRPYLLPAAGVDIYRNFVTSLALTEKKYVRAVEFQPHVRLAIHHAQIAIDSSSWSRERDTEDDNPGFFGMEFGNNENPDGNFVGWTPGQVPFESIPGAAWALEPGTDLIARLHLTPTGRVEKITPRIGLYFTDKIPTRITDIIHLSKQKIDIPAGEANYLAEESLTLPVPVQIVGIFPHAHYIGKELEIFATFPTVRNKRFCTSLIETSTGSRLTNSPIRFGFPPWRRSSCDIAMIIPPTTSATPSALPNGLLTDGIPPMKWEKCH